MQTATSTNGGSGSKEVARIAVVGAGWWSQGWHLPLLHAMPNVQLVGIVEPTSQPRSTLVADMLSTTQLAEKYGCPVFDSIDSLLAHCDANAPLDGVIIASPHATHADIAMKCFNHNNASGITILCEKPMTTDVEESLMLVAAAGVHWIVLIPYPFHLFDSIINPTPLLS
jgi:predicted dehydrogenase